MISAAKRDNLVRQRADARCEYCRMHQSLQGGTFHLEHIVPISRGGDSELPNFALACPGCNLHKAARTEFADPLTGEAEPNKSSFGTLFAKRAVIDKAFGGELEWMRMDNKRACRIRHTISLGGLTSGEDTWPTIQDATIDAMDRLVKALKPHITELP